MSPEDRPGGGPGATPPIVGYARAISNHRRLCAAIILATIFGAVAWMATHGAKYEASSRLLVSPLAETDRSFVGVPVIRAQGAEPGRPVSTAAVLAEDSKVAVVASRRLDDALTPEAVEIAVEVIPVEDENIVELEATASSAEEAAAIADAYAAAVLAVRRDQLKPLIDAAIERTEAELAKVVDVDALQASELQGRLADLRLVEDGTDPTLTVVQRAGVPEGPRGPPRWLLLALALVAGIGFAAVAAVVIEILAPGAIDEEDELLRSYPLPILARVPKSPRDLAGRGLELTPETREAFRAVRGQLELHQGGGDGATRGGTAALHGVVAITSAMTGDGKTTAAVSLASVSAGMGPDVILFEADFRTPQVAERLGAKPERDLIALIATDDPLGTVATTVPGTRGVKFIPAPPPDNMVMVERLSELIPGILAERARREDAFVVVDTAALGEVSDALPIVAGADQVVVAVRMGHTTGTAIESLRSSLERAGVRPAGYVVFDSPLVGGARVERRRGPIRRRAERSYSSEGM